MTCNFRVGQKVILAKNFGPLTVERAGVEGVTLPVKGAVYTIREFDADAVGDDPYIRLVEVVNDPHVEDGIEPSFEASMFRPVAERGTDIGMSILRNLLNKTGKPVGVDA